MRIGCIGLGHIGGHMAANLLAAGHEVTVHDLDRRAADSLLAAGASWADSPAATARASDAVPLDIAGTVEQLFIRGPARYGGSAEYAKVAKLLEEACDVDLRAPGFPATLEEYLATMPRAIGDGGSDSG
jgi:nucleoside-diphosphate-sugar epimerase